MKVYDGIEVEGGLKVGNLPSDSANPTILTWAANKIVGYRTMISTFLGLSDTPNSYSGQSGKAAIVNQAENGLEFLTLNTGAVAFTGLNDTPANYSGARYKSPIVDPDQSELLFFGRQYIESVATRSLSAGTWYDVFTYDTSCSFDFTLTLDSTTSSLYSMVITGSYSGSPTVNRGFWNIAGKSGDLNGGISMFETLLIGGSGSRFAMRIQVFTTITGTWKMDIVNKNDDYLLIPTNFVSTQYTGTQYLRIDPRKVYSGKYRANARDNATGASNGVYWWTPATLTSTDLAELDDNARAYFPQMNSGLLMRYNAGATQQGDLAVGEFGTSFSLVIGNNTGNIFLADVDVLNRQVINSLNAFLVARKGTPIPNYTFGFQISSYQADGTDARTQSGLRAATQISSAEYTVTGETFGASAQDGKLYYITLI